MPTDPTFADMLLTHYLPSAAVLTLFVTTIAYLQAPKLKVFVFSMPVPFTCAFLATDMPINATHIFGLILVVSYHWVVYTVHVRWGKPLWAGIGAGVSVYLLSALCVQPLVAFPIGVAVGIALVLWLIALVNYRAAPEVGYRSTAPWYVKLPLIFTIAIGLFSLKDLLAGAVTTFPYAGVFTSYEMRHNLRALAGQFTVTVVALLAMMVTIYATHTYLHWPKLGTLAAGWAAVFTALLIVYPLKIRRVRYVPPEVEGAA